MESVTFNTLPYANGACLSLEAEFIAVREGFRIACGLEREFDQLVILTDCQSILRGMAAKSKFPGLRRKDVKDDLFVLANSLYDVGITVELRWVPAHAGIEGNERVDKLAARSRKAALSLLPKEDFHLSERCYSHFIFTG